MTEIPRKKTNGRRLFLPQAKRLRQNAHSVRARLLLPAGRQVRGIAGKIAGQVSKVYNIGRWWWQCIRIGKMLHAPIPPRNTGLFFVSKSPGAKINNSLAPFCLVNPAFFERVTFCLKCYACVCII